MWTLPHVGNVLVREIHVGDVWQPKELLGEAKNAKAFGNLGVMEAHQLEGNAVLDEERKRSFC